VSTLEIKETKGYSKQMKTMLKKIMYLFLALIILIAPYFFFTEHKTLALYIWVLSVVYFLFIKNKLNVNDVSRETKED